MDLPTVLTRPIPWKIVIKKVPMTKVRTTRVKMKPLKMPVSFRYVTTITYNPSVRFIDEGIDKTEEMNPHLVRVLDSPETTIDTPPAIFREAPIKSSIQQHHDNPEPPLKKSKPTTPSSQSHIALIGCEEDRDDLLTRTHKIDDDIVLENEIKEHTTKQSHLNELEQLRQENQKLRTLLKQFLSQDKKK